MDFLPYQEGGRSESRVSKNGRRTQDFTGYLCDCEHRCDLLETHPESRPNDFDISLSYDYSKKFTRFTSIAFQVPLSRVTTINRGSIPVNLFFLVVQAYIVRCGIIVPLEQCLDLVGV